MIVNDFDTEDIFIIRKVNRGLTGSYSNKTEMMKLLHRTRSERTIEVEVTLISKEGLDRLRVILDSSETVQFIFEDEKEWYWNGTLSTNKLNSSYIGADITLEILVPDGVKHAVNPKGPFTATLDDEGRYFVEVNNEGTVDAPITLTATMNAENGYIGVYTDYAITEIGNKEEKDDEEYVDATTILNTTDFSEFTRYTGLNPENSSKANNGTASVIQRFGRNCFHLATAGNSGAVFNGASYLFDFPADETGHIGGKNVYCYFDAVFWAQLMGQTGQMQILFTDVNNKLVMGYDIYKYDEKGNSGYYSMYYGDGKGGVKTYRNDKFTTSHLNSDNPLNFPRGHMDIEKRGSKITYYWFGSYPSVTVPELADVEITKCYINMYQYKNNSGDKQISFFDFRNVRIRNDDALHLRDIKNRFQNKSSVKMTGADSKVYVDGMPKLSEKVRGSNLFTVPSGKTKIYFECSSWCATPPTYQIEFTEVSV
jgi:predicted phage tail component-like protein